MALASLEMLCRKAQAMPADVLLLVRAYLVAHVRCPGRLGLGMHAPYCAAQLTGSRLSDEVLTHLGDFLDDPGYVHSLVLSAPRGNVLACKCRRAGNSRFTSSCLLERALTRRTARLPLHSWLTHRSGPLWGNANLGKVPRYQLRYVRIYWPKPIRG